MLGLLPLANWIAGGHGAEWFGVTAAEWASGSAIALGSGFVLFLVGRRLDWWPSGWSGRLAQAATDHAGLTAATLGIVCFAAYAIVAVTVLSGRPLLIDEIVQVMQARIFAEGRLARAADAVPEFFSALHVVDVNGKVFSQFPPGGPLMLVPGVLTGRPWLTGPVFGAVAVVAWWRLARASERSPGIALGATMLMAASPFMAFMAGSHMNHVPTLAFLCLAFWGLHRLTAGDGAPRTTIALAVGFCFGMMAAIRPVDGAAFALPAGAWLLWRTVRKETRVRDLVAAGIGVAVPASGVLAYNVATTGDPLLFGYELLWGASHGLGFHAAPWGVTHTPARGLELVNLYFLRLQTYLFESPLPSLLPATVSFALARGLSAFDRYLLASSSMLVLGYFLYWHDGFFLGPRFFYLLLPLLSLWTARLPGLVRARWPGRWGPDRFVWLVYATSAVVAGVVSIPVRARQYAGGLSSMRHDYLAPAGRAGIEGAVILVRESWGAQLIARLWGLGVSRSDAEAIYRSVDTCVLEEAVTDLERGGQRGSVATDRLRALTGDSLRLVESTLSPDRTERVLPGAVYGPVCQRRVAEDRAGYTFLAPLLARETGSNLYARDLHGRDTLLLSRHAGRPVYLLRAASSDVGAPLLIERVKLDSARADWVERAAR
ncbi:MAG: hypothetical protein HUU26_01955 [Gemmatimonadaceae bacterium]|nr:hypothetical protein [Gemmatimonadaceae bacterium]